MKYLPNYVKSRIEKNQNFVVLFVGQTGTGKSYGGMSLAEEIDPNFNIGRIVFSAQEFIELLNTDDTLTKGSVIMWDEAGVGMPAREWYSLSNKVISYVVQTFRVKGYILVMTTPSLRYIDSQIRSLFHGICEMIDPSVYGGTFGWGKYMHLVHDPKEGKTIMQYPTILDEHSRVMKLKGRTPKHGNMLFPMPSDELVSDYEPKKKAFTDNLIVSASDMMAGKEAKEAGEEDMSVRKIEEMILEDPDEWGAEYIEQPKQWKEHVYAVFRKDYPDIPVKQTDISAAIHMLRRGTEKGDIDLGEYIEKAKARPKAGGREPKFTEKDIDMVIGKITELGYNATAKNLNVSKATLSNFRKRMKKEGKWPENEVKSVPGGVVPG
jgi:hypothetical protein